MKFPTLKLKDKLTESFTAVFPITLIVLLLSFSIASVPAGALLSFIFGTLMLIFGNAIFNLGAEMSMTPMGERIGAKIPQSRSIPLIIVGCFILGTVITISEPDLQVLAEQIPSISSPVLIGAVAGGVGIFLAIAILRSFFGIKLSYILIVLYVLVFGISFFVPNEFLSVAFDSGGVTTGPMTVPFIIALGIGLSDIRSDKNAADDSFGLLALCSVGPIIAVLILGMVYRPENASASSVLLEEILDSKALAAQFAKGFPKYFGEVALSLAPIAACFAVFRLFFLKSNKKQTIKVIVGVVYTYLGLVLFLTGANVGFMPVGKYIGQYIGAMEYNWLLLPIGMIIGYFIVSAEPAVAVLNKQVEEITDGYIPQKAMGLSLSIGVSASVGLAMLRILTGIPILYIIIPGYAIALALTFFVPPIFTSIAFDSGGVASGTMTATFLLPFAMGACESTGGNIIIDAFGIIAMVAMTPLITIQLLGLYFTFKKKREEKIEAKEAIINDKNDDIIEL